MSFTTWLLLATAAFHVISRVQAQEGNVNGQHYFQEVHKHNASETAAQHLVEVFGGIGQIYTSELDALIYEFNAGCELSSHHHNHIDTHEPVVQKEVLGAQNLVEKYGINGILDVESFTQACPDILRCKLESGCELVSVMMEERKNQGELKTLKALSASVLLVEAVVGALVPMAIGHYDKMEKWISWLNCFTGGVLIATGTLHMIPHIQEKEHDISGLGEYPFGNLMVVLGYMLVLLVERVAFDVNGALSTIFRNEPSQIIKQNNIFLDFQHSSRPQEETMSLPVPKSTLMEKIRGYAHPALVLLAISVHALLEALALGLEEDRSGVLLLFASIASRKVIASMAISVRFVRNGASTKQVLGFMALSALVAPIGILIGSFVEVVDSLAFVIVNGLAAGAFLYIGSCEIMRDEFHASQADRLTNPGSLGKRLGKFFIALLGICVIALLQLIPRD